MLVLTPVITAESSAFLLSTKPTKATSATKADIVSAFTSPPLSSSTTTKKHEIMLSRQKQRISFFPPIRSAPTDEATATTEGTSTKQQQKYSQYKPREGIAQSLLNVMLSSPLWKYVLVPQARNTMIKTAEANGIPWINCKEWLLNQDGPWKLSESQQQKEVMPYPEYYKKSFHAYSDGNLSWDAALEQEIASCSVGARNFPMHGFKGEEIFRSSFDVALQKLGATKPEDIEGGTIVDLGCGTGKSTRRLAELYPKAKQIIGMDLSPYFVEVGKRLLELAPASAMEQEEQSGAAGTWVDTITPDKRIQLTVSDAANTNLPDESVDIVNLGLVLHELPSSAAADVIQEAHRILKPNGGQLWISEMDFESPAYAKQRANALLFSLLRATEPYLDEYADGFRDFLYEVVAKKFDAVKIGAATGRHYSLIAVKKRRNNERGNDEGEGAIVEDTRFLSDGSYALDDTHLNLWESKKVD